MENIKSESHCLVAVDAPLPPLTYSVDSSLAEMPFRGQHVTIPLGKRSVSGVVLGSAAKLNSDKFKIRNIQSVVETLPPIPEPTLKWIEWLSKYYFFPIGQIAALCSPPLNKVGRGSRKKSPVPENSEDMLLELTSEQHRVTQAIGLNQGFHVHLLHGVTGSGKTEVYLQLLSKILEAGKKGLVLVPEISLTPQLLRRFAARFPDRVAVIHSHLTKRERTEQWWSIISGQKRILVGARSALFCPIYDLGIIIVDEEHEASFKQDDSLKYQARDASIMLARYHDCPIVLGSATPSLETWQNALCGRYSLHSLSKRVAERSMPLIEIIDMKKEREQRRSHENRGHLPFWLSHRLHESLTQCFEQGDQAALFLNRRGIAQTVFCPSCGITYECPNCSISLTLHGTNHLVCHYCDYHEKLFDHCKKCGSLDIGPLGLGTELIEHDVRLLFPEITLARADRDEIQNRQDLENIIFSFEKGQVNLLIGTQMIAKGLDFKGLNLVGLVMADVGFNLPDFRASERSFQLLLQMGGRAGRHSDLPGRVIIQTYNPSHPSIVHAIKSDFHQFAQEELLVRNSLHYPPFSRLASFRIQGNSLEGTEGVAQVLGRRCQLLRAQQQAYRAIEILGPAPAPLAKLRGKHRFQVLIKSPEVALLSAFCKQVLSDESWVQRGVKIQIDIDPVNLL